MTARLGFLGAGWIGGRRLRAVADAGVGTIVAVADLDETRAAAEAATVGAAACDPGHLLELDLDGVVIATPSGLHAAQATEALDRGLAVFCQKPLGKDAAECASIVAAARAADRLLEVDLSYRATAAARAVAATLREGCIGTVFAADLVFHNAYGPNQTWCTDRALSGGGCVIDLGIHLVDLVCWLLGWPEVEGVSGRRYTAGRRLAPQDPTLEDYATARLDLGGGVTATLSCSWRHHSGRDAEIGVTLHGTDGSVALRNVDGSFFDFEAVLRRETTERRLSEPPDSWEGRTIVDWACRLGRGDGFDPQVEHLVDVAAVLDAIGGVA